MKKLKILILRNDRIGDMILSTPVFREIKKKFPASEITVICSAENKDLIEKNPYIDEIVEHDIPKFKVKTIFNYLKLAKKIKEKKFDIGFDLRGSLLNTFFLLWLTGIKKRVGLADSHQNKFSNVILNCFLNIPIKLEFFHSSRHITKDNLLFIEKGLGIKSKDNFPEIFIDENDEIEFKKILESQKIGKYICLFPIARLDYKQWPIEKWRELIKNFECAEDIFLVGKKEDEVILKKLAESNKKCKIILDLDLRQIYLLAKNSKFVIAQDGGPMHIAWTSQTKLIVLMSNYHPLLAYGKYFPLRNSIVIFAKNKDITSIEVNEVVGQIKKILKRKTKEVGVVEVC